MTGKCDSVVKPNILDLVPNVLMYQTYHYIPQLPQEIEKARDSYRRENCGPYCRRSCSGANARTHKEEEEEEEIVDVLINCTSLNLFFNSRLDTISGRHLGLVYCNARL